MAFRTKSQPMDIKRVASDANILMLCKTPHPDVAFNYCVAVRRAR